MLQPEPYWLKPRYVEEEVRAGDSVPAYSYAGDNPMLYVDPDGLDKTMIFCDSIPGAPKGSTVAYDHGNAPIPGTNGGIPGNTVCDDCDAYNINEDGKCPLGRKTSPLCACRKALEKEICRQCKQMKLPKKPLLCQDPGSPHPV